MKVKRMAAYVVGFTTIGAMAWGMTTHTLCTMAVGAVFMGVIKLVRK